MSMTLTPYGQIGVRVSLKLSPCGPIGVPVALSSCGQIGVPCVIDIESM